MRLKYLLLSLICLFTVCTLILPLTSCAHGIDRTPDPAGKELLQLSEERFKEAVSLFASGEYEQAENILQDFVVDERWQKQAHFLLGRIYKEQGFFEKAEDHLNRVKGRDFLLGDYVLKALVETYMAQDEFEKALQTARGIKNKALLQTAKQYEIKALIELGKENRAIKSLRQYIRKYPDDWDSRLVLARLTYGTGRKDEAVGLLKDVYINAGPLAADALKELEVLNAVSLSLEEVLERAGNLFEGLFFQAAEDEYVKAIKNIKDPVMENDIRFKIGMCLFRQKKYDMAAESFGYIKDPRAMYWMARSAYRSGNMEQFKTIMGEVRKEYPKSGYLVELLLISAEDRRRAGELDKTEEIYKSILKDFPKKSEDALWGLGWMSYTSGDYKKSKQYFSELESSVRGERRYKYTYWKAKSLEMLAKDCEAAKKAEHSAESGLCGTGYDDVYREASKDTGYYGMLSRISLGDLDAPEKLVISKPEKPEGGRFDRIEMLKLLGMNEEAAEEIKLILHYSRDMLEFKYLGYTAVEVGEYKSVIYFTEDTENREFLPLSYPRGYWDIISEAAEIEKIDAYLIAALIREESRFDPGAFSAAGAVGLMQLMPATARRIKRGADIRLDNDSEIYSVRKNIFMGTHYLSMLIREFRETALAIAAYNAGENAVRQWVSVSDHKDIEEFIEDIPYKETRRYVKKVLNSYWQYRSIEGLPLQDGKTTS